MFLCWLWYLKLEGGGYVLKAIQIIQELPWATSNDAGRKLIIQDTESGERHEVPFKNGQFTANYKGHLFDYYGRTVEVDPSLKVLDEAGFWRRNPALLVKKRGRKYIAYVSYYKIGEDGCKYPGATGVRELNPRFMEEENKAELVCTDTEVIDKNFFPKESIIQRAHAGFMKEIWLAKKRDGFCLIWLVDCSSELRFAVIGRRSIKEEVCARGTFFDEIHWGANGKLIATISFNDGTTQTIATDDSFVKQYEEIIKSLFADSSIRFYKYKGNTK